MKVKLISRYDLAPESYIGTTKIKKKRLHDPEYDQLIEKINQFFIDNKDKGSVKVVFGNPELVIENFAGSFIQLFDDEAICEDTAKRFEKQLKKGDYTYTKYQSQHTYWYQEFEVGWM